MTISNKNKVLWGILLSCQLPLFAQVFAREYKALKGSSVYCKNDKLKSGMTILKAGN